LKGPDKEEGPPTTERPSQDDTGADSPAVTTTTGIEEDNTPVILETRAAQPPSLIFSDVSPVVLIASADRRLSESALRVLINLAGRSDKERTCYPRVGRIAHETGLKGRTVNKAIAQLDLYGYLSSRTRFYKQQQRSSVRLLQIPEALPADHPYAPWARAGVYPEAGRGWPTGQGGTVPTFTPRGVPAFTQKYALESSPKGSSPPVITPDESEMRNALRGRRSAARNAPIKPVHTPEEIREYLARGIAEEKQKQERDEERAS
jgi:hypothetical protein